MKRVIVCGGRDYQDREAVFAALDRIRPDLVIQGGATGADRLAFDWCMARTVECYNMPANWKEHGKAAGPIRNQRMIDEFRPSMLIHFPGGRGTADMISRATKAGLEIIAGRSALRDGGGE